MKLQIPWARLAAEGVVIVASILLAFAVDAWWAHAQSKRSAREAMAQILAEFEYNAPVLQRIIAANQAQGAATRALQRMGPSGVRQLPLDSLRSLIRMSTSAGTFDPSVGATNAAIGSGVLRAGGMTRVVRELEAWQAALDDVKEEAGVQIQAFYDFHQANAAAGTLSALIAIREDDGWHDVAVRLAEALTKPGLLREQHANMAMSVGWNTRELSRIEDQLERVLAVIAELDPGSGRR